MTNITIRDIDDEVFREFKAWAVRHGLKIGEALTQALKHWVSETTLKKKKSILDFKPVDFGSGSEKSSSEINKVLYGWEQ